MFITVYVRGVQLTPTGYTPARQLQWSDAGDDASGDGAVDACHLHKLGVPGIGLQRLADALQRLAVLLQLLRQIIFRCPQFLCGHRGARRKSETPMAAVSTQNAFIPFQMVLSSHRNTGFEMSVASAAKLEHPGCQSLSHQLTPNQDLQNRRLLGALQHVQSGVQLWLLCLNWKAL